MPTRAKGSAATKSGQEGRSRGAKGATDDAQSGSQSVNAGTTNLSTLQTANNEESNPPRPRRGRPKKATTIDDPNNTTKVVASVEVPTGKHARKPSTPAEVVANQRPPKRTKADEENRPACHQDKPESSPNKAQLASRDPLPDRPGRNVHPVPTKPKRRTSQEVEAEREAKRKALEARIRELEDAKRLLAQMNAAEDVEDEEMDEENPQRLSAAVRKRGYTEVASNSGDEGGFDFEGVNAMPDSSDNEQPVKGRAVRTRSRHKSKNSQKACRSRNPRKRLKAPYVGRFKIWLRGYTWEAMMGVKARELK
jgi:hypothetical protein